MRQVMQIKSELSNQIFFAIYRSFFSTGCERFKLDLRYLSLFFLNSPILIGILKDAFSTRLIFLSKFISKER